MNIAIVKRKFLETGGGGAEHYSRIICSGLHNRGHNISILAESFDEYSSNSYKKIIIPKKHHINSSGTARFHKNYRIFIKNNINYSKQFDVIYSLSRTFPTTVFRATEQIHAEWLKINKNRLEQFNPRHRGILNLEKQIYNDTNTPAVVTISKLYKRLINKIYNYPDNKIFNISNGVDSKIFYPLINLSEKEKLREKLYKWLNSANIILMAGSNFKIKGLKYAIESLAKLNSKLINNTYLVIAGNGDIKRYQSMADKLGAGKHIIFLGDVKKMRDYYASADIFLFPSLGESFGNAALEACACGIPIITTEENGACELVTNYNNGYLVPSAKNVDLITGHLAHFFNLKKTEQIEYGNCSLEISKKYTWERHLELLEKLFNKVSHK